MIFISILWGFVQIAYLTYSAQRGHPIGLTSYRCRLCQKGVSGADNMSSPNVAKFSMNQEYYVSQDMEPYCQPFPLW